MQAAVKSHTWGGLEELRDALRALLRRHCPDEHEIEDVIQETFVRAARYRLNLREGGRLKSWTMRIALNVLSDQRRRQLRLGVTGTTDGDLDNLVPRDREEPVRLSLGALVLEKESALLHLRQAFQGLRPDDRRLLHDYYHRGESCRATAVRCSIPPHLVKIRLFRARRRLLAAVRRRLSLHGEEVGALSHSGLVSSGATGATP